VLCLVWLIGLILDNRVIKPLTQISNRVENWDSELEKKLELHNLESLEIGRISNAIVSTHKKITRAGNHDALTNLPSPRLRKDRMQTRIAADRRNKTRAAFLFIDLDGFKAVNDELGHEAGDNILISVAGRLKAIIREVDTAARIGGDEFIIVLTNVGENNSAAIVAQKVIDGLSKPVAIKSGTAQIGASVGIAISPDNGTSPNDLLRNADAAMYNIKRHGKNNYIFYDEIETGKDQPPTVDT
jgi:diguanylate cyclase (GGDEF)-like protein